MKAPEIIQYRLMSLISVGRGRILSGDRDSDNDDDAVNDWGEELILMMMMTEITDMMKRIGGGYWGFITRKIMFAL